MLFKNYLTKHYFVTFYLTGDITYEVGYVRKTTRRSLHQLSGRYPTIPDLPQLLTCFKSPCRVQKRVDGRRKSSTTTIQHAARSTKGEFSS